VMLVMMMTMMMSANGGDCRRCVEQRFHLTLRANP